MIYGSSFKSCHRLSFCPVNEQNEKVVKNCLLSFVYLRPFIPFSSFINFILGKQRQFQINNLPTRVNRKKTTKSQRNVVVFTCIINRNTKLSPSFEICKSIHLADKRYNFLI